MLCHKLHSGFHLEFKPGQINRFLLLSAGRLQEKSLHVDLTAHQNSTSYFSFVHYMFFSFSLSADYFSISQ